MGQNLKMVRKKIHRFTRGDEFRAIVDIALSSTSVFPISGIENYTVAYAAIVTSLRREPIWEAAQANRVEPNDSDLFAKIAQELTFANSLHGDSLEPYFSLAHVLRDSLRHEKSLPALASYDLRWIEAIQTASAYFEQCRPSSNWFVRMPQARDLTFAEAIQYFADRGLHLALIGQEVQISGAKAAVALAATVAKPMRRVGDEMSSKFVDYVLKQRYEPRARRCRLHPSPDGMGQKISRSIPCGYLYRSLLKVIGNAGEQRLREIDVVHIESSAKHLAALYDVEPFSSYEGMVPPKTESALKILKTITDYDELFTIPQCRPEVMEQLLVDLFPDTVTVAARAVLGWGANEALCLWRFLSQLSPNDTDGVFIDRENLKLKLAELIGPRASQSILKSFVLEKPNREYHLPTHAATAESRACALVKASRNRYWRPGLIFLGPAFFDRMFSQLVAADESISHEVGRAFEDRMQRRFRDAGFNPIHGDYCSDSKSQIAGDIDVLLQSDGIIALIECKKKGMRRTTIGGNDLHLVTDLAMGLIHGINQLAKQEIHLLDKKDIRLVDGTLIEHKGRRVIKIVVSLADYGGLHDVQTLRHTMRAISDGNLTLRGQVPASDEKALQDANTKLAMMDSNRRRFNEVKNDPSSEMDLFSGLQFHNVFLIEELLEKKTTIEEFLTTLMGMPAVVTGTRDPIIDLMWRETIGI